MVVSPLRGSVRDHVEKIGFRPVFPADRQKATRKAFAEGSYEVTTSSYQPSSGELLVDGAVRRLAELKNDKR